MTGRNETLVVFQGRRKEVEDTSTLSVGEPKEEMFSVELNLPIVEEMKLWNEVVWRARRVGSGRGRSCFMERLSRKLREDE